MKVVLWTAQKAPPFLWRDGYSPWSQYTTSTINFWTLHHHSGCIPNGWRDGECHGRENLQILAWDKLWKESFTGIILVYFTWWLCFNWIEQLFFLVEGVGIMGEVWEIDGSDRMEKQSFPRVVEILWKIAPFCFCTAFTVITIKEVVS